jgi:hypothetical protein
MTRNSQDSRSNLTRPVRYNSLASGFSRLLATASLAIGAALCLPASAAAPDINMSAKQYAKAQLTKDHYKCVSKLYGKESAWNPDARSGSHHGIPQGRSKWLATATPLQQIDWGLAYIAHRYGKVDGQPNTCAALDHWKKYNWH